MFVGFLNIGISYKIINLKFISSIITLVSVLITVGIYHYEKEENLRNLLEALSDEIKVNIEISNNITGSEKKLLETDEFPFFRFRTALLEDVITSGKIREISLRKQLYRAYNSMDQANRILDSMPLFIPLTKEQYAIFSKLKKEYANSLLYFNNEIKKELLDLQPKIEMLIL